MRQRKNSKCITRKITEEEKIKYKIKERKVMNKQLKIDEQLRDLFPPLTEEEFNQLEENIKRDGCREPIATWNGYIVDGHNRYNICTKNNIEFQTFVLAYNTKDEVIQWMIETQLGRRNLTSIQRIAITEKYRKLYEEKAKENLIKSGEDFGKGSAKLPNPIEKIDTRKELSKLAGVGERTYGKGVKILNSDNEEIKQEVLSGEKKINTAYNELFGKPKEIKKEQREEIEEITQQEQEDIGVKNTEEQNKQDIEQTISSNNVKEIIKNIKTPKSFKKCLKCGIEKNIIEFNGDMDFCNECLENINAPNIIIEDYSKLDQEEQEVIKGMKTEKLVSDYLIISDELISIRNNIQEQIEIADNRIFERYNLIEKMSEEDKDNIIGYMDEIIEEIIKLKNKIKGE